MELQTNGAIMFRTILLQFHYFISLETANTPKSEVFLLIISLHQLLLVDILKFIISVLEKNFQKLFVSVFLQDFNHKFCKTFCEEQSHQLCLLLLLSQCVIHNIYILADIECKVLIRRIYISSSYTIISTLHSQC